MPRESCGDIVRIEKVILVSVLETGLPGILQYRRERPSLLNLLSGFGLISDWMVGAPEAAQAVEKWSGHNIDSSVRRGVGFGEGAVPHPQLEKFLIFSTTINQFPEHKIVKIRLRINIVNHIKSHHVATKYKIDKL